MDNQEERIRRLQNMGYELVKSTSSSLLFQVRAEKGFTGEAMGLDDFQGFDRDLNII
jgi:hypothetical protein